MLDGHHYDVADTLARGLEWAIRQHPKLLGDTDTTERLTLQTGGKLAPGASALTFRSVTWAPLTALQQAGAKVKWDKKTNRAIVSYQGRTLELRTCHNVATIGGRKIDLGSKVLLGRDGPVVPLREVAKALGMKVEIKGKNLRLGWGANHTRSATAQSYLISSRQRSTPSIRHSADVIARPSLYSAECPRTCRSVGTRCSAIHQHPYG